MIVMPARNEAPTIGSVVGEAISHGDVVVVDDASTDATPEIVSRLGAVLLRHDRHLGYAAAVRTGLEYAVERRVPIVLMDADGQHDPADIPRLLAALERADLVIGSRAGGSPARRLGTFLFSMGLWAATGRRVGDVVSGFKAFNIRVARALLALPSHDGHAETLLPLIRAGFRIREVPVTVRPRRHGVSMYNWNAAARYVWRTASLMCRATPKAPYRNTA